MVLYPSFPIDFVATLLGRYYFLLSPLYGWRTEAWKGWQTKLSLSDISPFACRHNTYLPWGQVISKAPKAPQQSAPEITYWIEC